MSLAGPFAFPLSERIAFDLVIPPILTAAWILVGRILAGFLKSPAKHSARWWAEPRTWWMLLCVYTIFFALTALDYFNR